MYNREKIINVMKEIHTESKDIAPYVIVCQPRRDKNETPAQNLDGYEGLHVDFLGVSHGFCDVSGEKVDVARNYLIERAIESGAKYLFFVGEDTVIPYGGYKQLHKTAEENPGQVIAGVYYIKLSNAMIMTKEENWISIPNVDPGQLIDAWMCGMDAMLIPIQVLKDLKAIDPEIPFTCIGTNIEDMPFIGEDNFFIHRLHKMGVKILIDTNVQCLHMDLASGKYTAHPDIDLINYYTNIPITTPLTMEDKKYIDARWLDRLPSGSNMPNKIQTLIASRLPVKFNIGSGSVPMEGYLNVDKYENNVDFKVDLLELNVPDECSDEILASHVLEHIPNHRANDALVKMFTMLKSGGKLILELPNIEKLYSEFMNASEEERDVLNMCIYGTAIDTLTDDIIKNGTQTPHRWGYYPNILIKMLKNVGFTKIEEFQHQGKHPGYNFRIEAIK